MFEELETIRKECSECQKCPLGKTRTKSVFSAGIPNNKIVLIGEAPGFNEDQTGEPFVVRQNITKKGTSVFEDVVYGKIEIDYDELDEGVLLKSDGLPTYNFANVIDDHLMQISHVVRGNEYISSTPKYNLIYEAFGWTSR